MIAPNFLTHFMIICALPMFSNCFLTRFCKSALSLFGNPVNLLTLALLSYDSLLNRNPLHFSQTWSLLALTLLSHDKLVGSSPSTFVTNLISTRSNSVMTVFTLAPYLSDTWSLLALTLFSHYSLHSRSLFVRHLITPRSNSLQSLQSSLSLPICQTLDHSSL